MTAKLRLDYPDAEVIAVSARHERNLDPWLERLLAELEKMTARTSQHNPGREIPEEHWAYRFTKKRWFFGFGAYS